MATDEQIADRDALLQLFMEDPAQHADGMPLISICFRLQAPMATVKRVIRANPAEWMLFCRNWRPGARHATVMVLCLSPAFQSQVPERQRHQQQNSYEAGADTLYCSICDVSHNCYNDMLQHQSSARHRARVLLQQLRSSGSINSNVLGLQVSEFPEGRMDLRVGDQHTLRLTVCNVGVQEQTLQRMYQVRSLADIVLPDRVLPHTLEPGEELSLDVVIVPRNIGILCSLIVLDFGVLIARELRVGCVPNDDGPSVDIGPTAPYAGIRRTRLPVQEDTGYVPGEKPAKPGKHTPWLRPPRQFKVPERLRRLVAEQRVKEVQAELDAFNGKTSIKSHLDKLSLLLYLEELQQELDMRTYDMAGVELLPSGRGFLALDVPGLAESRPSVLKGDALYVRPCAGGAGGTKEWQGFVHIVRCEEVLLKFARDFHGRVHVRGRLFDVRFSINRTGFKFMHSALDAAAAGSAGGARPELLLPPPHPAPPPPPDDFQRARQQVAGNEWANRQLNEEQQAAVQNVVQGSSGSLPFIVWGPPGTGKTSTLVECAVQVLRKHIASRLLVVVPSNMAADMLAERLLAAGRPKSELLRVCAYSRPRGDLADALRDVLLWDDDAGAFQMPTLMQALTKRVIVATPIMSAKLYALGVPPGHFSHVLFDEAGHAEEPLALCALAGLVGKDCRVVLAGDPKQLGPIIHSRLAAAAGLGVSLLERLTQRLPYAAVSGLAPDTSNGSRGGSSTPYIVKLVKNYRSHPDLQELPSRLFYGGELQPCADPELTHNLLHWPDLPNKKVPLLFHAIVGQEEREANSPSWFNVHEALVVVKYIQSLMALRRNRVTADQIGVIAPYRKQVQKMQKLFTAKGLGAVQVGTVEAFQGSERRVIIISTVRSNPALIDHDIKHKLGFVASPKRFNVAITRAKALLIVVGNPGVLGRDPCWGALLRKAQGLGCCAGQPMPDLDEVAAAGAGAGNQPRAATRDVRERRFGSKPTA